MLYYYMYIALLYLILAPFHLNGTDCAINIFKNVNNTAVFIGDGASGTDLDL